MDADHEITLLKRRVEELERKTRILQNTRSPEHEAQLWAEYRDWMAFQQARREREESTT